MPRPVPPALVPTRPVNRAHVDREPTNRRETEGPRIARAFEDSVADANSGDLPAAATPIIPTASFSVACLRFTADADTAPRSIAGLSSIR